ncbi:MAG: HIT domain-containing protein [Parcubacteria group bacterium]
MSEQTCPFCLIAQHKMPGKTAYEYEDQDLVAFKDIHPLAPVHLLIIPKKHLSDLNGLTALDEPLYGKLIRVASELAAKNNIADGWQLFVRVGAKGGQEVKHVHFHLVSGQHI